MKNDLEEFKKLEKLALRKVRLQSIILGSAAVITVLFMIYGVTQKIEADRQSDLRYEIELTSQKEILILKEQLAQCQSEKNK